MESGTHVCIRVCIRAQAHEYVRIQFPSHYAVVLTITWFGGAELRSQPQRRVNSPKCFKNNGVLILVWLPRMARSEDFVEKRARIALEHLFTKQVAPSMLGHDFTLMAPESASTSPKCDAHT